MRSISRASIYNLLARDRYKTVFIFLLMVYVANVIGLIFVYERIENEANIINQAGRQRMLSQKITKLSLLYKNGSEDALAELENSTFLWSTVHQNFMNTSSELGVYYKESPTIRSYFDEIDKHQKEMANSVYIILHDSAQIQEAVYQNILNHEAPFLLLMDTIVNQMETESERKSSTFFITLLILSGVSFLSLVLVIIFVFIPMINDLEIKEIELETNIREKQSLLAEIHHRVKNNLAVISSILQLQIIKKEFSPLAFSDAVNRIQSIARIHELLYQTNEFSSVNIETYIHELVDLLTHTYPQLESNIKIFADTEAIPFTMEKAVPMALLINELIINSLKHGFPSGDQGEIHIQLKKVDKLKTKLIFFDNGKGFAEKVTKGIGMQLIDSLIIQLDGEYDMSFQPSFRLSMVFMPN